MTQTTMPPEISRRFSGGGSSYTHNGDIISNASDPRQVAQEVAALWNRNPSFRPSY